MSLTLTRRYNADRFGYLIPHRYGNLPMVGAVATYRPGEGRFGRGAVAVEEGTTNLVTNPFFEKDWTDWNVQNATNGSTRTIKEVEGAYGGKVAVLDRPAGGGPIGIYNGCGGGLTEGDIVTVSFRARRTKGTSNVGVRWGSGTRRIVPISEEWGRYEITIPKDGNQNIVFEVHSDDSTIELDATQVEVRPFATSFVNGSREKEFLAFPMPVGKNTGTISLWIRPQTLYFPSGANWGGRIDLSWGRSNPNSGFVIQRYQGAIQLRIWDGVSGTNIRKSINYDVGDWIHCAITWDAPSISFFVNGEFVGVLDREINPDDRLVIGGASFGGSYHPGNALYDELLILPYAASEEEIVSWYEAQGPLPPHSQATLQWDWQAVRPAQIVKL